MAKTKQFMHENFLAYFPFSRACREHINVTDVIEFVRRSTLNMTKFENSPANSKLDWNDNLAAIFEAKLVINRLSSSVFFYCFSRRG